MVVDFTEDMRKGATVWFRWLAPPWPLAWHLGALVASVALPALLLGAYLLYQQHQAELATIERDATARVETISNSTNTLIMGVVSTLRAIGANPDVANGDLDSFVKQSQASFGENGILVTLRDDHLQAIKSTGDIKSPFNLSSEDSGIADEAIKTGNLQVSGYSVVPSTGTAVVHVWLPVSGKSRTVMIFDAMIPAALFNRTLLASQLPPGWDAGVSDRHDRIIARTTDYEKFSGQLISEDTRRKTVGPSGIMRSIDLIGRPTLQAYVHSDLTGWRLSTWAPRTLIEARVRENWTNFVIMAGALAALAAVSSWLWASRMTATVLELTESARRLESDRLLDKVETPVLEINKLRNTISAAAAELIRRKEALVENEERLRMALVAGDMGVWEWDPQTDTSHWDATLYRLTGFTSDKTPATGTTFMSCIHPDDRDRIKAALLKAEEAGEPYSEEFRFLRPDGSMRWLAGRGRIFGERAGANKRFIGLNFDITDEREQAARTRALLLEVSHRSKNLLAVILAIGRLTARDAPSVQAYERALTLRVGALAASQDLIVASDWQGVDLEALVHSQTNAVVQERAVRVRVSGPSVTLNPTAAQNIGMAFAELSLNAIDHGALANDIGTVTVSWELSPPGALDQITLSWTERDGPPVSLAQKRGYGMAVVERLVVQSLKASSDMQFAAEGVRWTLLAPLEAIVSREAAFGGLSPEKAET